VTITDLLSSPIAQDPAYHLFADYRTFLAVPNFWNVMSNVPFIVVGALGFRFSLRITNDPLRNAWLVFFAGIFLTAFGSGYYHLAPDNDTLAWDRLTMTIGFMSFVAIVIGEYVSVAWGRRLLVPLLATGAASVFYWVYTESLGAGDLRPYALVQFLPMLLIPLVVIARRSRSDLGPYIAWMIAFYVAAKVAEHYDAEIFAAGTLLSGHSLKHIFAALAPACLLFGLRRRRWSPVSDFPE
jgi:hypothetical protein